MKGPTHDNKSTQADPLEELFRHSSARERPPRGTEQEIRQALHQEWTELTRKSSSRRTFLGLAAVASVLLAVTFFLTLGKGPAEFLPASEIAQIEKLAGPILLQRAGNPTRVPLESTETLIAGTRIFSTAQSGLALRWLNGESVRVDQLTELRLLSSGEIELVSGRIYLDTNHAKSGSELVINTPSGTVRHLGTRYMAETSAEGTSVSVREGLVQVRHLSLVAQASRGEQLSVQKTGDHELKPVATFGTEWRWTEALAPAFVSDKRSIADFLLWVANETGREVEYLSNRAKQLATETELRGQIELEPTRALSLVMKSSDLSSELSDGTIMVGLPEDS